MKSNKKPHFVIFSPWAPITGGGVNNVINGLAEASREFYHPVIIVAAWDPPEHWAGRWLRLPYLKVSRPLGFLARLIPNLFRLRRMLRYAVAANPHFLSLECIPLILLRIARLGPPVILSIHGADVTEVLATAGLERKLCRWVFESADLVVGCSNDLNQKILKLAPKAKTRAIFNAVSGPLKVCERRPLESPYLLCVAGFVEKKAHHVLLSAFEKVAAKFPGLELVIIGSDGPIRPKLELQIEQLQLRNRVHILVDRPNSEVWWWMHHAKVFVLPSREEPFGIVLLEAGRSRTPVVATRVGGIPEFLTDKEDGLLCDPDRPDQLADAILQTLAEDDLAMRRVESFFHKASSFTWSRTFAEYRSAAGLS